MPHRWGGEPRLAALKHTHYHPLVTPFSMGRDRLNLSRTRFLETIEMLRCIVQGCARLHNTRQQKRRQLRPQRGCAEDAAGSCLCRGPEFSYESALRSCRISG